MNTVNAQQTDSPALEPAMTSRATSEHSHGKEAADDDEKGQEGDKEETQGPNILSTRKFLPIYAGILISIFLISLDNTIICERV